ncbi:sn-glycerol-3-phosphate transport system permease protein UgpE [Pullulanibacillus camelliae]|uniref:sn-glycerol-3-phosphate transport system permease protein UgpE n=1 Tax=Pullulanibacillus camelliae TaxID=1707096 RepID=A0A8J2VLI6_9BACL|nr:carbohydrate ABC transporter permease [Pullulanibacillus camelliae]GGE30918.1 sn-glycerol-3-phosphate transport system permease protein UgpE [Pullulanibacillus camelliae]
MTKKKHRSWGAGIIHVLLLIGVVIVAFPFVWMILSSFKSLSDFYNFSFLPKTFDFSAYSYIFQETHYLRWYLNSIIVAVIVTVSCIIFNSLIGYVLAKHKFPGASVIFILILCTLMIPTEMLVIPWYMMSVDFSWVDSYWGIMFPGMIEAFGVFLMRQFMLGVPNDILDAARIDGMSEFKIWWRVAMPQVKSAVSALGIITFLGNWNAYLWPVIITATDPMRTLPVGISLYSTGDAGGIQWNTIMAMSTLAVVPMIIVFLILQKRIVEGIALTGVKG